MTSLSSSSCQLYEYVIIPKWFNVFSWFLRYDLENFKHLNSTICSMFYLNVWILEMPQNVIRLTLSLLWMRIMCVRIEKQETRNIRIIICNNNNNNQWYIKFAKSTHVTQAPKPKQLDGKIEWEYRVKQYMHGISDDMIKMINDSPPQRKKGYFNESEKNKNWTECDVWWNEFHSQFSFCVLLFN